MSAITTHNMDCLPPDTLLEVAEEERSRRLHQMLSPDDILTSHLVELYARTKFLAMWNRARGDISLASNLEEACERIYHCLPEEHRW